MCSLRRTCSSHAHRYPIPIGRSFPLSLDASPLPRMAEADDGNLVQHDAMGDPAYGGHCHVRLATNVGHYNYRAVRHWDGYYFCARYTCTPICPCQCVELPDLADAGHESYCSSRSRLSALGAKLDSSRPKMCESPHPRNLGAWDRITMNEGTKGGSGHRHLPHVRGWVRIKSSSSSR
jgi:hypothetical protein